MATAPEVTILLLGDSDCGKSTFLSRISKGNAGHGTNEPLQLLRDSDQPFVFDIQLFRRPYRFEFHDTSFEDWTILRPDVIILCYDISSRLSLINTQRLWSPTIAKTFEAHNTIPVLFLGLKRDLRSETDPNGIIYPQEAYRIAQEMRCDKYMECSAITGELVHEVFEDICKTAAKSTVKEDGGLSEGGCSIM